MNVKLVKGKSLIIFDEVQLFPTARSAIKHLVADGRYHYIETGSLISLRRNVKGILLPSEERHIQITGFSGKTQLWNIFLTDMFYYRHHAEGNRGQKSVADNGGFALNLGYDANISWLDSLSASVGFIKTWYANKKDTTINSPLRSMALYSTFYIQKKFL